MTRGVMVRGLASVLVMALAACGGSSAAPATMPAPGAADRPVSLDSTTFAPDLAVDLKAFTRLPSGMYIFDAVKGNGVVAAEGRRITFRYSAFLADGSLVESQRQPIEADMNEGMIKGLRFGIAGMRAGGQRRLVVPSSLAYGRSQVGKVPPNSTLVFDIELVGVR
jgi:FKBP-type peptidyl-prolyl cis-trans isomerase FkpA